jgi:hypothetical protein
MEDVNPDRLILFLGKGNGLRSYLCPFPFVDVALEGEFGVLKKLILLLIVGVLFAASPTFAVEFGYGFDSGFVTVSARRTSDNSLVFSETLLLGQSAPGSSYVEWDNAGVPTSFGLGTITDLVIQTQANQGPYTLLQPYGPFDTVSVDAVTIAAGGGFATTVSLPAGGGLFNPFSAVGLETNAFYSASHTSGVPPPVTNVLAPIVGLNQLTGSVEESAGGLIVHINGALMGLLDGAPFGEFDDLDIRGDVTWFGSTGAFVPEPSTALLLGMGLTALATRRRDRD